MDSNQVTLILHGEQLGVHDNSIALLEEQVNVLQNTDVTMQERLDGLEAADIITDERLDELELAVNNTLPEDLDERVTTLENITNAQQNDIENLVSRDIAHDSEIGELQNVDIGFEQRITQLEDGGNISNVSIGFNARLTDDNLPYGTPILYENVMTNVGDRYSPSTGIFTADTAGLYYFEQYWVNHASYSQILYMYKNGVVQCRSYGDSNDNNYSPSCSAVMELSPGDEVYIISWNGYLVFCPECAGFTGFLVKAYS